MSKDWQFVQSFGDDSSSDDDLVTALQFDASGRYLAVGDKSGRVCIFESVKNGANQLQEYRYFTEFHSHEPEFDCLKSLEIEEKINVIEWSKRQTSALYLLATNDKTIKLWKVYQRRVYAPPNPASLDSVLRRPHVEEEVTSHQKRHVYGNAHQYHVNSVSMSHDGDHFLSADDLRINLWNVDVTDETFNLVDIKPNSLEDLTEVITSARFHPSHSHTFMYSSSRGSLQVCDMREAALCDQHSKQFRMQGDPTNTSFFSEITSSISDARFSPDGRFIFARDYLTMKVWDVNMERQPLAVIPVHDYLSTQLSEVYENDCIFDKFECDSNHNGTSFVSGSYSNCAIIHSTVDGSTRIIEADGRKKKKKEQKEQAPDVSKIKFQQKIVHVSWHPHADVVAVAGRNKLFIYQGL